jgi:hypothetical protein
MSDEELEKSKNTGKDERRMRGGGGGGGGFIRIQ